MPVSAGKKRHNKTETQVNKISDFLTHKEFKQKLFQEQPDVKKEYDALEPEYQREVADIMKAIGKRSKAKQA
jgi:hypothetical protein